MEINYNELKLNSVSIKDIRFLYELLKERDSKANISHKKMPTYSEHIKFVNSKPYNKWYIIKFENKKIGSIYLTNQNEIGIFIKKDIQGKNLGKQALSLMIDKNPRKRYLANVNPKNSKSIRFFKSNGFKIVQHTFELDLK
tara:strand:+ start:780 stop:1202 length:423 start_codon:yes stop_codon:yes gene_type:complete